MPAVDSFGDHWIARTTSKVEARLQEWIRRLKAERGFILGDNPKPVYELEEELKLLARDLVRLDIHFDEATSEDRVFAFQTATERLYEALELVRTIRRHDRGSTAYTHKTLGILHECVGQVRIVKQQTEGATAERSAVQRS